jgi:FG-GAP repeat
MPTTTQPPSIRRASAEQRHTTAGQRAVTRMQHQPDDYDDEYEYDDQYPPRMPTSARRYQLPPPTSASPHRRGMGIGGLTAVVFACVFMGIALALIIPPAWQNWRDSATYGYPRTFQLSADVEHGDPNHRTSHFIALNNSGVLSIIEIPGGDPATYPPRLYRIATLTGSGADLVVLTLTIGDINGDGKPDLIASYSGSEVILFNDGKSFTPKP